MSQGHRTKNEGRNGIEDGNDCERKIPASRAFVFDEDECRPSSVYSTETRSRINQAPHEDTYNIDMMKENGAPLGDSPDIKDPDTNPRESNFESSISNLSAPAICDSNCELIADSARLPTHQTESTGFVIERSLAMKSNGSQQNRSCPPIVPLGPMISTDAESNKLQEFRSVAQKSSLAPKVAEQVQCDSSSSLQERQHTAANGDSDGATGSGLGSCTEDSGSYVQLVSHGHLLAMEEVDGKVKPCFKKEYSEISEPSSSAAASSLQLEPETVGDDEKVPRNRRDHDAWHRESQADHLSSQEIQSLDNCLPTAVLSKHTLISSSTRTLADAVTQTPHRFSRQQNHDPAILSSPQAAANPNNPLSPESVGVTSPLIQTVGVIRRQVPSSGTNPSENTLMRNGQGGGEVHLDRSIENGVADSDSGIMGVGERKILLEVRCGDAAYACRVPSARAARLAAALEAAMGRAWDWSPNRRLGAIEQNSGQDMVEDGDHRSSGDYSDRDGSYGIVPNRRLQWGAENSPNVCAGSPRNGSSGYALDEVCFVRSFCGGEVARF